MTYEKILLELFNANSDIHVPCKKSNLEICTSFETVQLYFRFSLRSAELEFIFGGSFISTGYHMAVCFSIVGV